MITTKKFVETEFDWPKGFYSDAKHIGLKHKKLDFGWLYSKVPATAAGVYTTNKFCAAPTAKTKEIVSQNHKLQAIIANSAIANSCTGLQGEKDVLTEQKLVAQKLEINPDLVGVASTGLIGTCLPMDKIEQGVTELNLTSNTDLTKAILTTDTKQKIVSVDFKIQGVNCKISGFAKGSGMIHPKMATMLAFITTDVAIADDTLQALLSELTDVTFNQITVDGDTSTNDMVLTLANGMAGNEELTKENSDYQTFKDVLHFVLQKLAQKIAADGEGATKLVEANVLAAQNKPDAQAIAKAIVGSNLVKAALFGADPNWGRIISTIGATPATYNPQTIDIKINEFLVVKQSLAVDFDKEEVSNSLKQDVITLTIDLHDGQYDGQAWGCDLTYEYVKINATYSS
ncbi:MAG: bifunctional glutamate N-acetyltransferase/amino-acid acetyltransferase ArgJ [Liquorilactobacillus hordei]|uniref:Arginine biosynthesis bifunctional protein ArgJ n=1 Tax=Liquorilactobacillus hordei DSM 19519 TaxID=1423759 RepID=A0A0R1MPI9_9LACO|nr:bifunctional glutamate N-acetyltransferase/amino-acid acetyltransferase ArgJ [Liquorilactobacillus hordei]KRL07170.1 bifunctional ornithine acetyltransferase N-acetylglutamate synthase protein [Liquorilactobacillus hordei DSM 19519]MBZ2405827.1 bifunctional ornithine acetyltransferase/N-acetylglutamate synthase [Liquorilactobacillus hordei]QYH51237.1 bifunctional glutamate N-acetyltransferase/amino-acid acetyltransferase ArgJ [Liquorilactobacillus hordei DSM 19519]